MSKNISISKNVKARFKEYKRNDESIDEALLRLFDESNAKLCDYNDGNTSIKFNDENIELLQSHKAYATETYSAILLRLLESVGF